MAQTTDQTPAATWPAEYRNRETGHVYRPHHADEHQFVYADRPRYALAKGGEGGGKSVAGIVKDLDRVKRGMSGIMVSPDLPHFKRSLWPEFRRWCPWEMVVAVQRYRGSPYWEPREPFALAFVTGATLYCGGIEDPSGWEGPNVSFAHVDEGRRCKDASALKVLDGRVRIPGPGGEPPQLYLTTTPRMNWLYEYFGPLVDDDPRADFKRDSLVISLFTADNAAHLAEGFVEQRRQSLTEAEARVLLDAAWEDIDATDRFLPSMLLWDACQEQLPPLGAREPMVLCADAGVTNDSFALVGVTRHPARPADVAVRYAREWRPPKGGQIEFGGPNGPEMEIRQLAQAFNVVQFCYDPYQLVKLGQDLSRDGVVWCKAFSQGADRLEADKQLLDLIMERRLAHDGHADLRRHVDNANRKPDPETRKLRIVKREPSLKIDLCVALSMASYECLRLAL